jgi:hypothetical protein
MSAPLFGPRYTLKLAWVSSSTRVSDSSKTVRIDARARRVAPRGCLPCWKRTPFCVRTWRRPVGRHVGRSERRSAAIFCPDDPQLSRVFVQSKPAGLDSALDSALAGANVHMRSRERVLQGIAAMAQDGPEKLLIST